MSRQNAGIKIIVILLCFNLVLFVANNLLGAEWQGINMGGEKAINPFLSGGTLNDDINLFTGDINLSFNLISLSGPGGTSINVGLSYNSNIDQCVEADNDKQQAPWVGVGWSLEMPAIMADLKGTVDFYDDEYYFSAPGGGVVRLWPADSPNYYYLQNFQYWKIRRILDDEVEPKYIIGWEFIQQDGGIIKFGDWNNPNDPPVGYIPSASRIAVGRGATIISLYDIRPIGGGSPVYVPYQWDIYCVKSESQIDSILYHYHQQRGLAYTLWGSGIRQDYYYTLCSHPDIITDAIGRNIIFNVEARNQNEILVKHPSSVFLRYDSQYLDNIEIIGCNGALIQKYNFEYDTLINLNDNYIYDKKRYLISIEQYSNDANIKIPPMKFAYNIDRNNYYQNDNYYFGALKSIKYPTGAIVEYNYSQSSLSRCPVHLNLDPPYGTTRFLNATMAFHTYDYQAPYQPYLKVHSWNKGWREFTYQNYDGHSFSATGNSYVIWYEEEGKVDIYELINNNFIKVAQFELQMPTSGYVLIYPGNEAYLITSTGTPRNCYIIERNAEVWSSTLVLGNDNTDWGNSVVTMGPDYFIKYIAADERDYNIIAWKKVQNTWSQSTFARDDNSRYTTVRCADDYFVVTRENALITAYIWNSLTNTWVEKTINAHDMHDVHYGITLQRDFFAYNFREVGNTDNTCEAYIVRWIRNGDYSSSSCYTISTIFQYEEDYTSALASGPDYVAAFDPVADLIKIFEWNQDHWDYSEYPEQGIANYDGCQMYGEPEYFIYTKSPNLNNYYKSLVMFKSNNGSNQWQRKWAFGDESWYINANTDNVVTAGDRYYCNGENELKCGFLAKGYEIGSSPGNDVDIKASVIDNHRVYNLAGNNQLIDWFYDNPYTFSTSEYIKLLYKYDFRNQGFFQSIIDYPVISKKVISNGDISTEGIIWNYTYQNGVSDGNVAGYYKTIVSAPPHTTPASNGIVEHYFYNGLSGGNFPNLDDPNLGNGYSLYGLEFKTYSYAASLSTEKDSAFNYYQSVFPQAAGDPDVHPNIFTIRLDSTYSFSNGIGSWTKYEYNEQNGQVAETKQFYRADSCKTTAVTYACEQDGDVYNYMRENNMLVQPYQTSIINEHFGLIPTADTLRRSKIEWNTFTVDNVTSYRPYRTYQWLDNPLGDWQLTHEIKYYDTHGNPWLEFDALGKPTSHIYDAAGINELGSFVNADTDHVFASSLLDYCNSGLGLNWQLSNALVLDLKNTNGFEDPLDPPTDGVSIEVSGVGGGLIYDPNGLPVDYQGTYVLRFDYRVMAYDLTTEFGILDKLFWTVPELLCDGRWHTAFLEAKWDVGDEDRIVIRFTSSHIGAQFQIDNVAFFPSNCIAATQKVNYNKGQILAKTDNNGNSVRYTYDQFGRLVASTNFEREYGISSDFYSLREPEANPNYSDYDKHPNMSISTSYPSGNLITNGDFEYGLTNWKENTPGVFSVLNYYLPSCTECSLPVMGAKVCFQSTDDIGVVTYELSQKTSLGIIREGENYTVRSQAWCNNPEYPPSPIPSIKLTIVWYDQDNDSIDASVGGGALTSTPELYELHATAPIKAVSAELRMSQTSGYERNYYCDQVEFICGGEEAPAGQKSITFTDGLGNVLQKIIPYEGVDGADIISATTYDQLFRPVKSFKPYEIVQSGNYKPHQFDYSFEQHANDYYGGDPWPYCNGRPYTETVYEQSPKGRVIEVYPPGYTGGDQYVKYEYGTNDGYINGHAANSLFKTKAINEDGVVSVSYKDLLGRTVESTADSGGLNLTSRGYSNVLGEVLQSQPPKAVAVAGAANDLSCFKTYDSFGRVLTDSGPDYGKIECIYDAAGRARFTRNSNQRNSYWTETQYDELGRIKAQGQIAYAGIPSDPNQNILNPNAAAQTILRYYYDSPLHFIAHPEWHPELSVEGIPRTRGLVTGTDNGVSPPNEGKVNKYFSYDKYGQVMAVETAIEGMLGDEFIYNVYNKSGRLVREYYPRTKSYTTETPIIDYEYDQLGRLKKIIDFQKQMDLASYEYMADGSLVSASIGENRNVTPSTPVETINYDYNSRGWLTQINGFNEYCGFDGGDKFGEMIGYESINNCVDPNTELTISPNFSGSPSWVSYSYDPIQTVIPQNSIYICNYDRLGRLSSATYNEWDINNGRWTENLKKESMQFSYDENSNISSMYRYDTTSNIQDYNTFSYVYPSSPRYSNRLDYIEASNGFQANGNYGYDNIGNCTSDHWRGVEPNNYRYDWRNTLAYSKWNPIPGSEAIEEYFTYDSSGKRVKKHLLNYGSCDSSFWQEGKHDYSCEPDSGQCLWVLGDINGDGEVKSDDYTFLESYLKDFTNPPIPLFRADLNCDDEVDLLDLSILEYYISYGSPTPSCCYWENLDNMTFYIYSSGKVASEINQRGNSSSYRSYIYGPNGIVCAYIDSAGPFFYLNDHLGSTRVVVDTLNNILAQYYYLPSGDAPHEIHWQENVETPLKFQGKELDNEGRFNLYYFGARYFDPFTCSWKQVDPAGQFASPYSFEGGSLLAGTDPDGRMFFLVPLIIPTIFGAMQGGIMSAAMGGNFWEGAGYGALGGAMGGGISAIGGAYSQNLAFNVMSRVATDAAVTTVRGGNYGLGNLAGSMAGAGLSSVMGDFSGLKSGGWAANAGAEIAVDAIKGAYVGAVSNVIGAAVAGGDAEALGNAFAAGLKGGAIGGAVNAGINIGMMGPTWSKNDLRGLCKDARNVSFLMGRNQLSNIAVRRGGLVTLLNGRDGFSFGRNIVAKSLDNREVFIEELIHSYQFMSSGLGNYEALHQQLRYMGTSVLSDLSINVSIMGMNVLSNYHFNVSVYEPYYDIGSAEQMASMWADILGSY